MPNNTTTHPVVEALRSALASATDNLPDMQDSRGQYPGVIAACKVDILALQCLLADDGTGNPSILAYLPAE